MSQKTEKKIKCILCGREIKEEEIYDEKIERVWQPCCRKCWEKLKINEEKE